MNSGDRSGFRAGSNIAMKVPPHQFDATVAFYQDVIGLRRLDTEADNNSVCFAFGAAKLWIDSVVSVSQAELWLEIDCDDTASAASRLKAAGVTRCDEIERLPANLDGFWISNPAGIIHLVNNPDNGPDLSGTG